MHDFYCTDADDMYYGILAERVRYFKEDEGGICIMRGVMEEYRDEIRKETALEAAKGILSLGKLTYSEIATAVGLTVQEVEELDKKRTA